jgi:hypothetical protein
MGLSACGGSAGVGGATDEASGAVSAEAARRSADVRSSVHARTGDRIIRIATEPSSPPADKRDPQPTEGSPAVDITGPDILRVELDVDEARSVMEFGYLRPIVLNTGSAPASLRFTAVLDEAEGRCGTSPVALDPATSHVPPNSIDTSRIKLTLVGDCAGNEGTLIITTTNASAAPVTARFALVRDARVTYYWWPFFAAMLVAAGVLGVLALEGSRWKRRNEILAVDSSWSFKDSWLTNFSALGAILGTLLAASGLFDEIMPGVSTAYFLGLNVLFGGLVLSAPVIYAAASVWRTDPSKPTRDDAPPEVEASGQKPAVAKGRVLGILLGTSLTVWGVSGQLFTLILLTWATNVDLWVKYVLTMLLLAALIVVVWYAVGWSRGVTRGSAASDRAATSPPASAATSATL